MVKIYGIRVKGEDIKYVGKTNGTLNRRLTLHKYESKRAKNKTHKHNWILKNIDSLEIILIEEVSKSDWQLCEKKWIAHFGLDKLTNSSEGGLGGCGKKLTKLHKSNISKAMINLIEEGKVDYKSRAKKISKANKGRIVSENTKEKLRQRNLGVSQSIETRKKKSKGGVLQIDKVTNKIINEYLSLHEAAKAINAYAGNISSACTGRLKTYRGYIWKYKN